MYPLGAELEHHVAQLVALSLAALAGDGQLDIPAGFPCDGFSIQPKSQMNVQFHGGTAPIFCSGQRAF